MTRIFITSLVALSIAIAPDAAGAATGGRVRDLQATPVYMMPLTLQANVAYTISTSLLSPSTADTVLHVQDADDANGGFIAGNDDSNGTLASRVSIPAAATVRNVTIVVHAYSATTAGTAQLTVQWGTNASVRPISFGGAKYTVPAQIATTHFFTVQQQVGARNTVLLVSSGSVANGIAFDDNDGIDGMSWIHIVPACAYPCSVIVGSTAPETAGPTTLIWDDGMHQASCDADWIGDGLEQAIGTDPCNSDTDGDGLLDGAEVGGVNGAPPVKLPYYGADPLRQDLFLETDWVRCDPVNSPGFDCQGNVDYFKISPEQALQIASYFAPDVAVHIDNGHANTDPATRTIYGDWGRATAIPDGRGKCDDLAPERVGYFRHGLIHGTSGGQADGFNGYCFWSGTSPPAVAHELAHGMGLDHGGFVGSEDDINSKPNYRSIMNYSFLYDPTVTRFSRNEHGAVVLNPASINETAALGGDVSYLTGWPWLYAVRADGAIDWSRDGTFSTSTTAPITWSAYSDQSLARFSQFDGMQSQYPAAAWTRTLGGADRLYLITRDRVTGRLETRWTDPARLAPCRGYGLSGGCVGWTPAANAAPAVVSSSLSGVGGPAVAGYTTSSGPRLVALYRDSVQRLRAQTLTVGATGTESWTSPATVGAETLSRDPAAVTFGGKVYAFAPVGNQLVRWVFDPAVGTWSAGAPQLWSDGTQLLVEHAVAVAVGYQVGLAGPQLYAAVPRPGTPSEVALSRYDATTGRWVRMVTYGSTMHRPGLAYVPFAPGTLTVGRFYLTFTGGDASQATSFIAMTEGNDPTPGATVRRLVFGQPSYVGNYWRTTNNGTSLLYTPGLDTNLRAMLSFQYSDQNGLQASTLFAPLADGIFNLKLRDHDDYAVIRSRLGCSLTRSCP